MDNFSAGHGLRTQGYTAFIPSFINRKWSITDQALLAKLSKADRYIGRLDSFSSLVDMDLYTKMHVTKEATLSSRIEGTRTNVRENLMEREDVVAEKRDDWEEVQNYIAAMQEATSLLRELPFSSRLIRRTHAVLMKGVRGQHKAPGTYRTSQNWIGGGSLSKATFIPPPHTYVQELMGDLELFANDDRNPMPDLLKVALIHYQLETIHPFLDGNGRVGRLLITLYLIDRKILTQPVLYLSAYFERHRQMYYDRLTAVREQNDLLGWFHFFLDGVLDTAISGVETFRSIIQLRNSFETRLASLGNRQWNAQRLLTQMFSQPVLSVSEMATILGASPPTVYTLVADLEQLGLLEEITGGKRGKLYAMREYLALFE
jgi:Fic family protein